MGAPLFLFGTLCWQPLLDVVAGGSVAHKPAQLPGYASHWVKDQPFPILVENPAATAAGILIDPSDDVIARLDFYEAAYDYVLTTANVLVDGQGIEAQFYVPPTTPPIGDAWDVAVWGERHGALITEAAREVMSHFGKMSPKDTRRIYPQTLARADARLRSARDSAPVSTSGFSVKDVQRENGRAGPLAYSNFFAVAEDRFTVPRFSGAGSLTLDRSGLVGCDVVILLPYDPERDRVLLIEQFRAGPTFRGDPNPWIMEPVAGRIDPGETPEIAARRECAEEAGLAISTLHLAHQGYSSPGAFTEYAYSYVGIADLPDDVAGLGGLETEGEDIKSHLFEFDAFRTGLENGAFPAIPLANLGYWLILNRSKLRETG